MRTYKTETSNGLYNLTMPPELKAEAIERAQAEDLTLAQLMRKALRNYLATSDR